LVIGNDFHTVILPDTDTRVGGSQINSIAGPSFLLAISIKAFPFCFQIRFFRDG